MLSVSAESVDDIRSAWLGFPNRRVRRRWGRCPGAADNDPRAARVVVCNRATVARLLDELNGNIVFTYRAGHSGSTTVHSGSTTVICALARDETVKALAARYFKVIVF